MAGIVALLAALVLTGFAAWAVKAKNGRFKDRPPHSDAEILTATDIGAELGERATLVQFSSAFCSPCRATRVLLTDIAAKVDGVTTVDIDAEEHLDMVRRLGILRTPTVLVLDGAGTVSTRASGLPRREQVLAALGQAVGERR
ncbi:TlpA family protein disulfide reductase [Aeromicrobium ginsengisoli]|uniref:Thioredoxin family protein n=1 Tax=Aeromicrobium ginsengisoli TaxID=363867 RepID=A0A5M4FBB3_9ACTN|nr:thioredoxin family protein [Aeromicrobium ginsengisoli]KAA1395190.1 thioredoxin family protein [Aeromicrobium ginsengisoli]